VKTKRGKRNKEHLYGHARGSKRFTVVLQGSIIFLSEVVQAFNQGPSKTSRIEIPAGDITLIVLV